jgi:hypothetical protein
MYQEKGVKLAACILCALIFIATAIDGLMPACFVRSPSMLHVFLRTFENLFRAVKKSR